MLDQLGELTAAKGRISLMLPRRASYAALWCLNHLARKLVALGVSANAVSMFGLGAAAIGGAFLSTGQFGFAAVPMIAAALGDALDGLVARRSGCASVSGALLDASVDRYEEFLLVGGLAIFFRSSAVVLGLALGALAGAYMISYGSAKAESLGMPVPTSAMRRPERAICLCVGVAMAVPFGWAAHRLTLPPWVARIPPVGALAVIAVVANLSAIRRLRLLGRTAPARFARPVDIGPAPTPQTVRIEGQTRARGQPRGVHRS